MELVVRVSKDCRLAYIFFMGKAKIIYNKHYHQSFCLKHQAISKKSKSLIAMSP
jgi:hypothetical protein